MPSLAAEGGTQARWELTVKPCPPCGPSGIPWSLPICVPQPSRRSGLPRTWVHPDARTRGEVPMGDLPLPLPRNMGTNLCLRHVPRHPHHPGHGPPLAPPPPQHRHSPTPTSQGVTPGTKFLQLQLDSLAHPAAARESTVRTEKGWGGPSPPLSSPLLSSPPFPHSQAFWAGDGAEVALCTLSLEDGRA